MKLFAFYVGGETETSNTELHELHAGKGKWTTIQFPAPSLASGY
jgi:hypothetical protein